MAEKKSWRLVARDRSFNINVRKKVKVTDLYHSLLSVRWASFLGILLVSYLLVNLFFACGYFFAGPGALEGIHAVTSGERFLDSFFFSVQTLATIGYGRINPVGVFTNLLVTIEALIGLLGLAVATGLFYARFSRPTARVIFSQSALVSREDDRPVLIFRMANERFNQIVEATVSMTLIRKVVTKEGVQYRDLFDLKLERHRSPLFALTWTVVHPINTESPLSQIPGGFNLESLKRDEAEIIVTLTGTDETMNQTIHDRFSYAANDLVWNARFKDMIHRNEDGMLEVNVDAIDDWEPLDT